MTAAGLTVNSTASPVATRGVTDIADRVVERIAGRAALDVKDVRAPRPTGLSRLTVGSGDTSVDAHVDGRTVALDIELAITYPAPIRTVARRVQAAVRLTVERLTGLEVIAIRVKVVDAPVDRPAARRAI
jgi:uncharacterized alkaline shock family protein YloU